METAVLSFRISKPLRTWLTFAAKGFRSEGELVGLILAKAARDQASQGAISSFLGGLLNQPGHNTIGDSVVLAVRLPSSAAASIRQLAADKHKTVGQWCGLAVMAWHQYFSCLAQEHKGDPGFLAEYGRQFRAEVPAFTHESGENPTKESVG